MRQKIAILQSERERLEQRLQLLESRASPPAGSAPAASELAWQRPSLDVVRLTPSTARPATEPVEADANERYLIYGSGDALHVRELPAEAGGDEATVGQGETP